MMQIVIDKQILLAERSLYAKQWWCKNLTLLRKKYTNLGNCFYGARKHNLIDNIVSAMDTQAWIAKHAYFKILRK